METTAREFDQKSSQILAAASRGETVTVTKNGTAIAGTNGLYRLLDWTSPAIRSTGGHRRRPATWSSPRWCRPNRTI